MSGAVGLIVVLLCAVTNKFLMRWIEWVRNEKARVLAEIAEMQREIDIH